MTDKIVVITGASRGLGLATAQSFSDHGWTVYGIGRSSRPSNLYESVNYWQFDASNGDAAGELWKSIAEDSPSASICLVNNAGGYVGGKLADLSISDYEKQMQSCYFTSVSMTQGLINSFSSARIINVVSSAVLNPAAGNTAYGSAKAAEQYFFQSLEKELDNQKYKITNLYPDKISSDPSHASSIGVDELANLIQGLAEGTASYYMTEIVLRTR